jgi:hypothetical protein
VKPVDGLSQLRRLYANDNLNSLELNSISMWAAYFGDPEFALNAMERSVKLHTLGLFYIWAPIMREVRQLPRFKEFVKEIGLIDYWKKYGWPDLCRPVGEDGFVCD